LTSKDRAECEAKVPCWSKLLAGTNFTSGRDAAAQIAAASAASLFLPFLTKGSHEEPQLKRLHQRVIGKPLIRFRHRRPEPDCMARFVPERAQTHMRSPFSVGCTKFPHPAGRAQEDETILNCGGSGHTLRRFVRLDPPGLIRPW